MIVISFMSDIQLILVCPNLTDFQFAPQISHKINKLAFGDYFPGVVNPLDRYVIYLFPHLRDPPFFPSLNCFLLNGMHHVSAFVLPTVYNGHNKHQMRCMNISSRLVLLYFCYTFCFIVLCVALLT